ncbi:hypothetical protein AsAng_0042920 [Aureispira anguillae]|uniref:Uncharacterized protein n=1 Tax=Aureispira anguillae TaxID=2864201 RepID=A0A915YI80_9BACT|nr:hypothetical protein AsAng_0042920 [Aureispira anguillae]
MFPSFKEKEGRDLFLAQKNKSAIRSGGNLCLKFALHSEN